MQWPRGQDPVRVSSVAQGSEITVSQDQPEKLGRYEITRFLGKGAMGIVYEGHDPNIGRRVAIKTARRDVLETSGHADEMMERFLREARAAGALNHANIVTVYDADEQDGTAYIAMEFVEGTDLQQVIEDKRRYTPEEVAELCATICDALHHAHSRGVIHRDVKPANIMLSTEGSVRVTDFGIARMADSSLTIDGAMIGTPHYMSPEQFMGQRVDGRSDLFSVGVIAYVLLTGERPFGGDALATVMHAVTQVTPIAPRELNFSVSPALNAVVLKALSKAPNQRYQDAAAMAAALREAVKSTPDPAVTLVTTPAAPADPDGTIPAATLRGTAPPNADATIPMGTAIPPAVGGGLNPPAGPVDTAPADSAQALPFEGSNRKVPVFGGLIVAVLIGIGALFLLSGGETDTPAPPSDAPALLYAVPAGEHYFNRILVHAFLAADEDEYIALGQGQEITDADAARLAPARAQITVTYPNGETEVFGPLPGSPMDTPIYHLDARADRFTLTVTQEGYIDKSVTVTGPNREGAIAEYAVGAGGSNWPFLLCPVPDEP